MELKWVKFSKTKCVAVNLQINKHFCYEKTCRRKQLREKSEHKGQSKDGPDLPDGESNTAVLVIRKG